MFNIEAFKANGLKYGGVRPSLFEVLLTFPSSLTTIVENGGRFLVRAASLPASIVDEISVPYMSRKVKIPGDRVYQDWPISVMADEDYIIRNAFEEWHNQINAIISNRMSDEVGGPINGPQSPKVDIIVNQLGKVGPSNESGIIRSVKIVGAFPTQVGPIGLDWDQTNTIAMFDVNFAYDYWEPIQAKTQIFNPVLNPE